MRLKTITVFVAVSLLLVCTAVYAEDGRQVSLFSGSIGSGNERSITGEAEYSQILEDFEPFGFSVAYLNEGHLDGIAKHHRDGFVTQAWAQFPIASPRFTLGVGIGPYYYFDTVKASKELDANKHGLAGIVSVNAGYAVTDRWGIQLRTNYVKAPGSIDTFAVLGGVGYRFDVPVTGLSSPKANFGKNQITILLGETAVNNNNNKHAFAHSVEYRRTLLDHVDWTMSYLDEGKSDLIDRRGGTAELWATQRFFGERLDLGIGGGVYGAFDSRHAHVFGLNGIISLTAGYRFGDHWGLRAQLHRVVTDHDRDSDVFLGGIGYIF
jgi:hypothetical protein